MPTPGDISWFTGASCAAIHQAYEIPGPPVRNGADATLEGTFSQEPAVIYDRKHHLAARTATVFAYILRDTRALGLAPPSVTRGDLSSVHLRPGIRIGTPQSVVLRVFGKPRILQHGCGQTYLAYKIDERGATIDFLIRNGTVVQIGMDPKD